jgi:exosome complex RNA-binding protein Rrp4
MKVQDKCAANIKQHQQKNLGIKETIYDKVKSVQPEMKRNIVVRDKAFGRQGLLEQRKQLHLSIRVTSMQQDTN